MRELLHNLGQTQMSTVARVGNLLTLDLAAARFTGLLSAGHPPVLDSPTGYAWDALMIFFFVMIFKAARKCARLVKHRE